MDLPGTSNGSLHMAAQSQENNIAEQDFKNTENKPDAFTMLQDIADGIRELCNYVMCDKVLRFYAEHERASKITVKEFFDTSEELAGLEDKLIKTDQDFDEPAEFEYIFDDAFHNNPIRQELKSYVQFYVSVLYEKDAPKDHFVEQALKYMPFRDCTYLCEAFPKENEELNVKDLSLFLSIAAVLAMLDECKKRNVLTKTDTS